MKINKDEYYRMKNELEMLKAKSLETGFMHYTPDVCGNPTMFTDITNVAIKRLTDIESTLKVSEFKTLSFTSFMSTKQDIEEFVKIINTLLDAGVFDDETTPTSEHYAYNAFMGYTKAHPEHQDWIFKPNLNVAGYVHPIQCDPWSTTPQQHTGLYATCKDELDLKINKLLANVNLTLLTDARVESFKDEIKTISELKLNLHNSNTLRRSIRNQNDIMLNDTMNYYNQLKDAYTDLMNKIITEENNHTECESDEE